jgi:hypothetical protein
MADWHLLDDKAEGELHKNRLLPVEYRPFKRLVDRIGTVSSVVSSTIPLNSLDTPKDGASLNTDFERLREDITADFALFDSTLLRLQYLHDANKRERERYRADQERILLECQSARATNGQLREQLDAARATLAQRKKFDDMADKITSNRLLRPREDQLANLAKLEEECKELERESETYSAVWKERRIQFNRIMEEGMLLRRQIRDEKEEVDRREGMNEGGDDETGAEAGEQTPRPDASRTGSPVPEGDEQPKTNGDGETPQPHGSHAGTPMRDSPGPSLLQPGTGHTAPASRNASRQPSREPTPLPREDGEEDGGDEEMEDTKDSGEFTEADTPQIAVEPPRADGDSMDVDS